MADVEEKTVVGKKQIRLMLHTGEEHNLHISNRIDDDSDLMYPAYQAALASLKEILRNSLKWTETDLPCPQSDRVLEAPTPSFRMRELYEYSNNILAFCADRGQGKTSAMLSFAEALRLHSIAKRPLDGLSDNYFYVLPPIDPTLLSKEDSVVEITLSRLYHEFNSRLKSGETVKHTLSGIDKAEILQNFQNCLYGLRAARQQGTPQDDFEALSQLGDCFEVKNLLSQILSSFFKFIGMPNRHSYLVVLMDDTDLQFQHAYESLEEARKYLSLPNVVVLMATDLSQLRRLVIDHYLATLSHAVAQGVFSIADIRRMAVKYLDKLIPASQAIYLPTVKIQCENHETIMLDFGGGNCQEMQQAIFQLIRKKTGLVFAPRSDCMHDLIPTTLRGLRQLYRLLDQMEDCGPEVSLPLTVPEDEEEAVRVRNNFYRHKLDWISKRETNLALFEDYFFHDWCSSKLLEEDWSILRDVHQVPPTMAIAQAVKLLRKKRDRNPPSPKKRATGLRKASSSGDRYVDMITLLDALQDAAITPEDTYFVYAVHTYFAIHFHKLVLKGWLESLYSWSDGGRKKPFQIQMKGLYERFRGGLFPSSTKKTTITELVARLPWIFTASGESMDWAEEVRMLLVLDYAVLACCNWDVQELTRTYPQSDSNQLSGNAADSIGELLHPFNSWLEQKCGIQIKYKNFFQLLSEANQTAFSSTPKLSEIGRLVTEKLLNDLKAALNDLAGFSAGDKQAVAAERRFEDAIAAAEKLQVGNTSVSASAPSWVLTLQEEKDKFLKSSPPKIDTSSIESLQKLVSSACTSLT